MDVFKKQVPAGLKRLAGLLECRCAIDKAERFTIDAGGNLLNNFVYSGVRPKAQCIQIEGALVVRFRLFKISDIFEGGGEPEMGIGIIRINLQRRLKISDRIIPVTLIGALCTATSTFAPWIELVVRKIRAPNGQERR